MMEFKNTPITVPIKSLSNFFESLKIQLINCKVELKLKCRKHCVLSMPGPENAFTNSNIILTIKGKKIYVSVVTLSPKDNKKLSKILSKVFE